MHRVLRHAELKCDGISHYCTGCNKLKDYESFPKNRETPCGFDPRCKECRHMARRERMGAIKENPRAVSEEERTQRRLETVKRYTTKHKDKLRAANRQSKLRANFNMTIEQYAWLLSSQNGVCALCEQPEVRIDPRTQLLMNLAIDHDRRCCSGNKSCGKCIRGLLCTDCNTSLGKLECKPKLVEKFNLEQYINNRPLENYGISTI